MSTVKPGSTIDLTSIPRAVLSVAVGVVHTVERAMVGDARIRTARGNAWEAICADRDRALRRDEIRALVAALAATSTVGTVPPPAGTAPETTGTVPPPDGAGEDRDVTVGLATPIGRPPAGQLTVGSSPRSSASHATLVRRPSSRPPSSATGSGTGSSRRVRS